MGKKPQKHEPTVGNSSTMKSSKPLEKVADSKLPKKKKFRGKRVTSDKSVKNLNKIVANVKRSKEAPSCNWQAFVASGFAQSEKSSSPKLTQQTPSTNASKRFIEKRNRISQGKNQDVASSTDASTEVVVDFSTDDTYVTQLVPKSEESKELTKCIAMDCEMVGVYDGKESVLARVSLVNQHGVCVYDRFVKPKEKVADYRTKVSGVRPTDLKRGEDFEVVQKQVAAILDGRILVGHAVKNDLKVLMLNHSPKMIRDTSRFKPFRNIAQGRTPALKKLASEILGTTIQCGEHSSVEDAKATMQLYNLYQKEWEEHRLKKKEFRRKRAIEAAAGRRVTAIQRNKKPIKSNDQLLDEFVAF